MNEKDPLARPQRISDNPTIDNPDSSGTIREITAYLPQGELLEIAERYHTAPEVRAEVSRRMRAYVGVLTSEPDQMHESLRTAVQNGIRFPYSGIYPLTAGNAAIFSDERELRDSTGDMATELIAEEIGRIQEQLQESGSDATKFIRNITLIAQARVGGAQPNEIITPQDIRLSVATELVSKELFHQIGLVRQRVQSVMGDLTTESEAQSGIKAPALARSMQLVSQLCKNLQRSLEELRLMSSVVTTPPIGTEAELPTMVSVINRANEIFRPFIEGSHMVTMEQLRKLDGFLSETGSYNANISQIIRDGIQAIEAEKADGNHGNVAKIERAIDFDQRVPEFERVTRALDRRLTEGAIILAYAGEQNRMLLRSVPAAMVEQAEAESGVLKPGSLKQLLAQGYEGLSLHNQHSDIRELKPRT